MDRSTRLRNAFDLLGLGGWVFALGLALVAASTTALANQPCGTGSYPFPYTDVASVTDPFCPGIMEAYVTGISRGIGPTMFGPNIDVSRLQMTTFLQRTVDQGLRRASRRAALGQWWTLQASNAAQTIPIGTPFFCAADGADIWVTNGSEVIEVRASTGKALGTWTGAISSVGVLAALGKVFVTGSTAPGILYVIDPTLGPGPVFVAASNLGDNPVALAFDGTNLWTANSGGSVSIITPTSPYTVTTVSTGFTNVHGILYDGAHIWVAEESAGELLKLDAVGNIVQTVTVGSAPVYPVFDGANIWVPNFNDSSVTVVQASTGNVVATIGPDGTNLLKHPTAASFDGERVMVANNGNNSVTVFKAADLSVIANVSTGGGPFGPCSDGINFWVPLFSTGNLLRF